MRLAVLLVLVALAVPALAPAATAQTVIKPVVGNFTDIYYITGRGVDALGEPTVGADVTIELEQDGVKAEPLRAVADCFGVFITYFTLKDVDPRGKAHVTLHGRNGVPDVKQTISLDPFFRRSDLAMQYEGQWNTVCPDQTAMWSNRISVTGRLVNRTDTYEVDGFKYDSAPVTDDVVLLYWDVPGVHFFCPPHPEDLSKCDVTRPGIVDKRGDFKYSWTFEKEQPAVGLVQVVLGEQSWNFTVDPVHRVAVAHIDVSGRGPPEYETPAVPPVLVGLAVALVGLVARRLLPGHRD